MSEYIKWMITVILFQKCIFTFQFEIKCFYRFFVFFSVLFPGELEQIHKSHTHFMKDLEERLQNWKLQGIVGDIFTKLSGSYHVSEKPTVTKYNILTRWRVSYG